MLLANKHFTPVLGIDIHIVILFGVPVPLPHPYIGMVMDVMDYIPFMGSTVNINNVPKGNSQTSGVLATLFHIPMGGPFLMAPMIGHDSVNFFGSTTVHAEDNFMSPAGYMVMTCNDIGIPLTLAPGKKLRPIPSFYLPSSMSIPMPMGQPVFVGGPYAPDWAGVITGLIMSYGMGGLMKKVGGKFKRGLKNGMKKLNHMLPMNKATKGLKKSLCKFGFEPIDLVTGRMVYEGEDFVLSGPIPIRWERNWYSDSEYEGLMGYGFSCNYDLGMHINTQDGNMGLRLTDGRLAAMPILNIPGEQYYDRSEKLTLTYIDKYTYEVEDHEEQLTYTYSKRTPTLFKPTEIRNPEGFTVQMKYNSANVLTHIVDSVGRNIALRLDSKQRVTEITAEHRGETRKLVSYGYNNDGDLIRISDALDQPTLMEYENHLMLKKTDRNGQSFYWEYDGNQTGAKCIATRGDGNILSGTLEYHKGYNIITNSLGEQSIYYFNELNLCTQVTDAMGGHIFHEYTEYMEPYRDIDEEGNATGYSYDERGNLVGLHQPDGSTTTFVYDEKDRLVLTKYPVGGSVIRTFKEDRLHAVIDMDGGVTSFGYNEKGLINEVRDNAGNISSLAYDKDFNLSKMVLPNKAVATWKYDAWGRCHQTKNAAGHEQNFIYDDLDRVRQVVEPDNNAIQLKYNAYDEVVELHQKNGKVKFEYTPMGSLKMREERGRKVFFDYDTEEQLRYIDNEHGERYRFKRNPNGQIITEIGFDGLTRMYQRDRAGKVYRVNRPGGKFTEYEYDNNGRITRAEHSDGTWETYSYDRNGNLIEAVNQNSTVQLIRDNAGRVIAENQDGHLVESTYDNLGNRIQITSSLGAEIDLLRNKMGQIETMNAQVSDAAAEESKEHGSAPQKKAGTWSANFAYNSVGMEIERLLPGGVRAEIEYDEAGRPVRQKVTRGRSEMRHRTYNWSVNDRLKVMVDQLTKGHVSYTHDQFGNLASAKYENHDMDYKLPDEVGNLYRSQGKNDRKYGAGGQLLQDGRTTFKYDDEGNLIEKRSPNGTEVYDWYGNGMLQAVTKTNGEKVAFEYDALGRRTAKNVIPARAKSRSSITRFIWDGNVPLHEWKYPLKDRPEWVVDEWGMLTKDKEEPVENLITWVFDEGTFKPAAKIVDGEHFSIITDYLGTPVEMYNAQGARTWAVEYDIYGKVRKLVTGSLEDCPFRYQGQYEDSETGLYYNRFRYYSADEGAYISQDPIGLAGGMPNMYAYVHDSNSRIDVFGLRDCSSAKLAKNLEAAGDVRPNNTAAHHIVGSGKKAKPANDILKKHNIDIDSSQNGVFLPRKGSDAPGHLHLGRHTDAYLEAVNKDIIRADKLGGKPAVEKQLAKIKQGLLDKSYTPLQH
ncbi:hypothetical protein B4Q04_21705 [Zobellia sp. OII3]|uniref:RHS repeat-associated core domain-containing protein n=1 Tax=Zobellia sp. OII3 TaxID=2034520 RepID=UPI000B52A6AF|nr:RHS repeat-associated core domain-containing protein [Zobellia sp. OII3]OWW23230.1 hypothetical protein B4Q04_21705 [Zobellia sp. OII3]